MGCLLILSCALAAVAAQEASSVSVVVEDLSAEDPVEDSLAIENDSDDSELEEEEFDEDEDDEESDEEYDLVDDEFLDAMEPLDVQTSPRGPGSGVSGKISAVCDLVRLTE